MAKTRVLVVDDHALVRQGLVNLLAKQAEIEVVGSAGSAQQAIEQSRALMPDVVLMDISMPDMSGIEATARITASCPTVSVILLTASADELDLCQGIQAGASGYLLKDTSVERLVAAIQGAPRGEVPLSPQLVPRFLEEFRRLAVLAPAEPEHAASAGLSAREQQVLRLLAEGLENHEIARRLHVSEKTVKNHVRSLLQKLGLRNRTQAAVYAVLNGLAESPATR